MLNAGGYVKSASPNEFHRLCSRICGWRVSACVVPLRCGAHIHHTPDSVLFQVVFDFLSEETLQEKIQNAKCNHVDTSYVSISVKLKTPDEDVEERAADTGCQETTQLPEMWVVEESEFRADDEDAEHGEVEEHDCGAYICRAPHYCKRRVQPSS